MRFTEINANMHKSCISSDKVVVLQSRVTVT